MMLILLLQKILLFFYFDGARMIEIIVKHLTSEKVSEIVKDLKDNEMIIGVDFDFEFTTAKFNWDTGEHVPRQTKFTFYNESYGTMFFLKWYEPT